MSRRVISVERVHDIGWRVWSEIDGHKEPLTFFYGIHEANQEAKVVHDLARSFWEFGERKSAMPLLKLGKVGNDRST